MRTVSFRFTIFLVPKSPTAPVIYSLKFLLSNFLGIDFLAFSGGHHCKNKTVLEVSVR